MDETIVEVEQSHEIIELISAIRRNCSSNENYVFIEHPE